MLHFINNTAAEHVRLADELRSKPRYVDNRTTSNVVLAAWEVCEQLRKPYNPLDSMYWSFGLAH